MCLIKTLRAFCFWPPAWNYSLPGGPVDTPSSLAGVSHRLRTNKALWFLHPLRGIPTLPLFLSFLWKQIIFCSWWLKSTSAMCFLCDPQTVRQCLLPVVSASCSVLATFVFRHFLSLFFFLHCFFSSIVYGQFCKWTFIVLLTENGKTIYLLCFVTLSDDSLFGENNFLCTIKNYSFWISLKSEKAPQKMSSFV